MNYSEAHKKELRDRIKEEIDKSGLSIRRFAGERLGFNSPSKLTHVLNSWDKAGMVGDATWEIIEKYIGKKEGYRGVATSNLIKIWDVCERAYSMKSTMVISGEGGYGKTFALNKFKEKVEAERRYKVYYFDAAMAKTRKQFVVGLMEALGCHKSGTMAMQIPLIRATLEKQKALLIIDEASALEGRNVVILKDIMTAIKDVCGMVLAGTPYFVENINKGASRDKHLFSETKDRLFMIPEKLTPPNECEAEAIFKANGVTGEALNIVMGRVSDKSMFKYSWRVKPTFRGIADCIVMIKMLTEKNLINVEPLQVL